MRTKHIWSFAVLGMALSPLPASAQSASKADASAEKPCTEANFLIGDWTVARAGKEDEVTADVTWRADMRGGCSLVERWRGRNGSRDYDGLMAYSNESHTWAYMYVGIGVVRRQEKGVIADQGIQFVPTDVPADGKMRKFAYVDLGGGRAREIQQVSADGGKTWTDEFNLVWVRKK